MSQITHTQFVTEKAHKHKMRPNERHRLRSLGVDQKREENQINTRPRPRAATCACRPALAAARRRRRASYLSQSTVRYKGRERRLVRLIDLESASRRLLYPRHHQLRVLEQ